MALMLFEYDGIENDISAVFNGYTEEQQLPLVRLSG